ncbi:hypothetical protein SAMN05216404_104145 [Nitrosospira multiformis]|uniref:Uncharacterized protein n=1 Tax=Nitrosospira multiformis TaxID=1231 RepID=A0A1H8GAR1_9PROT|nr:hypothetical protein SAMN05216404_104145 [Nitrosospira multiformis]
MFPVHAEIGFSETGSRAHLNHLHFRIKPELDVIHIFQDSYGELRISVPRLSPHSFSSVQSFDDAGKAIQRALGVPFQGQRSDFGISPLRVIGVERIWLDTLLGLLREA